MNEPAIDWYVMWSMTFTIFTYLLRKKVKYLLQCQHKYCVTCVCTVCFANEWKQRVKEFDTIWHETFFGTMNRIVQLLQQLFMLSGIRNHSLQCSNHQQVKISDTMTQVGEGYNFGWEKNKRTLYEKQINDLLFKKIIILQKRKTTKLFCPMTVSLRWMTIQLNCPLFGIYVDCRLLDLSFRTVACSYNRLTPPWLVSCIPLILTIFN